MRWSLLISLELSKVYLLPKLSKVFQGISLSTICRRNVVTKPESPEAKNLKSWYDIEGKETSMSSIGSGMSPSAKNGSRSMYIDRVNLSHTTSNPSLAEDKLVRYIMVVKISDSTAEPRFLPPSKCRRHGDDIYGLDEAVGAILGKRCDNFSVFRDSLTGFCLDYS